MISTKKLVLCSILLVIFVVVKENLSFFYERTLLIAVYTVAQNKNCKEVFVWGELSPSDVANADNLLGVYTVRTSYYISSILNNDFAN